MQNLVSPPAPRDPNAILNECVEIEQAIDSISTNLQRLRYLQTRAIDDPDASPTTSTNREIDTLSSETMSLYRNLSQRIIAIKQTPTSADARNKPRVGMVDRKLRQAMNEFQQVERDFRKKLADQMARQYRIVNPEASEEEIRTAVEDTENNQVFSQAVNKPPFPPSPNYPVSPLCLNTTKTQLLQSSRRGQQSQSALRAVQARHEAIQKIERQMIELAQLFQDIEAAVISHEVAVEDIESKTELIAEHVAKGNKELDGGIKAASSRNRKKWYCLGALGEFFCPSPPFLKLFFFLFFLSTAPPPCPAFHLSRPACLEQRRKESFLRTRSLC